MKYQCVCVDEVSACRLVHVCVSEVWAWVCVMCQGVLESLVSKMFAEGV